MLEVDRNLYLLLEFNTIFMNKVLTAILVVAVIIVAVLLLTSNDAVAPGDDDNNATTTEEQTNVPDSSPQTVEVSFTDDGYSPRSITIDAGDTVRFVNNSDSNFWPASAVHPTHEVYDGTTLNEHCTAGDVAFDACGPLAPGDSWSFTFNKVGTWNYHDHRTPSFTGSVTVE